MNSQQNREATITDGSEYIYYYKGISFYKSQQTVEPKFTNSKRDKTNLYISSVLSAHAVECFIKI